MAHSSENQFGSSTNFTLSEDSHSSKVIDKTTTSSKDLKQQSERKEQIITSLPILQPQQIVGNCYQVIQQLEQNKFTTTYLIKDIQDKESKLYVLESIDSGDVAVKPVSERVFLQQVKLVKKLSTHIQIPKLLTHIIHGDRYYVVYEYTEGEFLHSILSSRMLNESEIVNLIQDVARIYDFAIKSNIVEFNILPHHILKSQTNKRYVLGNLKELFFHKYALSPLSIKQQRLLFQQKLRYLAQTVIQSLVGEYRELSPLSSQIFPNWQKKANISPKLQTILRKMLVQHQNDLVDLNYRELGESRAIGDCYHNFQEIADEFEPLLKVDGIIGGKYRLISYLEEKNQIRTYLARHLDESKSNSSLLVVKQFTITECDRASTATKIVSLEAQVEQIEQLSLVPGLDLVREQFEDDEELYLIRDYVEGISLAKTIERRKSWTLTETIDLLEKILDSLNTIHQKGLIHRNLKPANLIISGEDRRVVLVDLGLLQTISETKKLSNTYSQTRQPPEQIVGRPTVGSDLYGLGIAMLEVLTGLSSQEILNKSFLEKGLWQAKLTNLSALIPIIERTICPDVEQRYQSTSEVLQDLQQIKKIAPKQIAIQKSEGDFSWQQKLSRAFKNQKITLIAIAICLSLLGGWEILFPIFRPQYRIYRGKQQLATQPEVALNSFELALKLQPNRVAAWQGKGKALLALEEFTAALKAYETAIEIDPDNVNSWQGKGNVFYRLGDFPQALENYDRALAIQPDNIGLLRHKGKILFLSSRYKEAISLQQTVLEVDNSPNIQLMSDTARSSLALRKYNQALSLLIRVQSKALTKPYLWQDKVTALQNLDRPEEALQTTRSILEIYDRELPQQPENLDLWLGKAEFLARLQRDEESLDTYQKATLLNPNSELAWLGKSQVLLRNEKYSDALDAVERALQIEPQSFVAWHTRGAILQAEKNDPDLAIASYDKALKIEGDFFPSLRDRSSLLISQQNYHQAIESLQRAVEIAPQDVESWLNLSDALEKTQEVEDAIRAIEQVIVLEPRNSQHWLKKGYLWETQQQYTKACDVYRQGIEIAPDKDITVAMQKVGCHTDI